MFDSFSIKIIAFTTMILDHIGVFLFPEIWQLRFIGRLSFPLFAWMIASGAHNTKNFDNYLRRMMVFALISQIPYFLAEKEVGITNFDLNIMFTLSLGLLCIKMERSSFSYWVKITVISLIAIAGEVIKVDYGAIGIYSIYLFYIYYGNNVMMTISQIFLYWAVWGALIYSKALALQIQIIAQPFAVASMFIISKYNGKQGTKTGYLFYMLYPLQFVIFYLILKFS